MKIPLIWWIPKIIGFVALMFYQAYLEASGSGVKEKSLRRYWLLTGIVFLFAGALVLYYAPTGGRIRTETASRIFGGFMILFGIVAAVLSRGQVEQMASEFERATSDRTIIPDPDRYVSPRERVAGKTAGDEQDTKPWS